jgi:hypothetical protein
MYLQDDYSIVKIAKILNAEAVKTKRDKQWHMGTVKLVLTNPNYVGKVRYAMNDASRYFEADGHHTPIIDEVVFNQVQTKMGSIKRVARTKRPSALAYFCGVLYCPLCGGKLSTRWQYKKGEYDDEEQKVRKVSYPGYQCISASKYGGCTAKSLSHTKMERAFEEYIERYADLTAIENEPSPLPVKRDNKAEMEAISVQITQIEDKTREIMSLFVAGTIDFAEYQEMTALGNSRRIEVEKRLEVLQSEENAIVIQHTAAEIAVNIRDNWAKLDNEERLKFVQTFIKKIVVRTETHTNGFWSNVIIDEIVFNEF